MTVDKLLTAQEVADRFHVGLSTIFRLKDQGDLPAIRIGERSVRFDPKAVEEYIIERSKVPA